MQKSAISFLSSKAGGYNRMASTGLSEFILNNCEFDLRDIVDVYTTIVRETAYSASDARRGFDSFENLKELMRYRYITRLLGSREDSASAVSSIYRKLQSVPKIRDNDQFWLQYAMSEMDRGELSVAADYIETAMGIAARKGVDYNTRQIRDQRARLMLRRAAQSDAYFSKKEVSTAIDDLLHSLSDDGSVPIYALRSADLIYDFLECHLDNLDDELVQKIRSLVREMWAQCQTDILEKSRRGETRVVKEALRKARLLLANI